MGLQVIWISMVLRSQQVNARQQIKRSMSTEDFKKYLERVWVDSPVAGPYD